MFHSQNQGMSPELADYQRRLAETLIGQGTSAEPVQHWAQGAARLAQALVGSQYAKRANESYGQLRKQKEAKELADWERSRQITPYQQQQFDWQKSQAEREQGNWESDYQMKREKADADANKTDIFGGEGTGYYEYDPAARAAKQLVAPGTSQKTDPRGSPGIGYHWSGPTGTDTEANRGGPAAKLSSEVAARLGVMDQARRELPAARKAITEMGWGGRVSMTTGIGETSQAISSIELAKEAMLRLMSGAGVPETEVERYRGLLTPHTTDSPERIVQKLDRIEGMMADIEARVMRGHAQPAPGQASPAAAADTQAAAEGEIYENPSTGERIRLVNGQWVPVQ